LTLVSSVITWTVIGVPVSALPLFVAEVFALSELLLLLLLLLLLHA
jgi:hypothetical protein